jgi:hypothetical protein
LQKIQKQIWKLDFYSIAKQGRWMEKSIDWLGSNVVNMARFGNQQNKRVQWWISKMLEVLKSKGCVLKRRYIITLLPCTTGFKWDVKAMVKAVVLGSCMTVW